MTNAILRGKPDAGNPHVRFDEGEVASEKPRRGSLLYTRSEFLKTAGSAAILAAAGDSFGGEAAIGAKVDYAALQVEIDEVTPQDFKAYLDGEWDWFGLARKAALQRLDDAFDKVLAEVKSTVVTDRPAVWLVYNMGVIVKSKEACFSIDLKHRKAPEIASLLDFALITHNHGDHYTGEFYKAMNGAGKTVSATSSTITGPRTGARAASIGRPAATRARRRRSS